MTRQGIAAIECPYVGLSPYEEGDASLFFGREADREIVIDNFGASRVTVIYGESGVGKSSLLNAGVVSHMRQQARANLREFGSPEYAVALVNTWSGDPVHAIEDAVASAAQHAVEEPIHERPAEGASLAEVLGFWANHVGGDLYVILDQFEEYFRYHGSERGEGTLSVEFPRAVNRSGLRVNFLIAIREDALARLDVFKPTIPALLQALLRIEHLDIEAGRAAIVGPLEYFNQQHPNESPIVIEEKLIEAVLGEICQNAGSVGSAGALEEEPGEIHVEAPLLQLVLSRLWDEEMAANSQTLRFSTLKYRVGGEGKIVETHVFESLGRLSTKDYRIALDILGHLVTSSGTKQAQRVSDLAEWTNHTQERTGYVLEALTESRYRILRPLADGAYEVFHDVLAGPIREILSNHRARLQARAKWRRRLRASVACAMGAILGLAALAFYKGHQAEQAGIHAIEQQRIAEKEKAIALAQGLASQAILELGNSAEDLIRSSLLAMKSYETEPTAPGERALREVLDMHAVCVDSRLQSEGARAVSYSPGGKLAALSRGAVYIWSTAATGELVGTPRLVRISEDIKDVDFAPEDDYVLVCGGNSAWIVHLPTDTRQVVCEVSSPIHEVAWSPDGLLIATASADGASRVWPLLTQTASEAILAASHGDFVSDIAFSPDSKYFASASEDGTVQIWDVEAEGLSSVLNLGVSVSAVAFDEDVGEYLATGDDDGAVKVWIKAISEKVTSAIGEGSTEIITWKPLAQLHHDSRITSISFSPFGSSLVSGSEDGTVKTWDLVAWEETSRAFHPERIREIASSSIGPAMATVCDFGGLRVWQQQEPAKLTHRDDVRAVALSDNGMTAVTSSWDHRVTVWNPLHGTEVSSHQGTAAADSLAADQSGERVATLDGGTLRLWDADLDRPIFTHEHQGYVEQIALRPDGKSAVALQWYKAVIWAESGAGDRWIRREVDFTARLCAMDREGIVAATMGDDGTVAIWDLESGAQIGARSFAQEIGELVFSPDRSFIAGVLTSVDSGTESLSESFADIAGANDGSLGGVLGAQAITVWESSSDTALLSYSFKDHVSGVSFSEIGGTFAAADYSGVIRIWKLGELMSEPVAIEADVEVTALQLRPDGLQLLTVCGDNTLRIWDCRDASLLTVTQVPSGIQGVAVSPDGRFFIAKCGRTVHVFQWPLTSGRLFSSVLARLVQGIPEDRLREYLREYEIQADVRDDVPAEGSR